MTAWHHRFCVLLLFLTIESALSDYSKCEDEPEYPICGSDGRTYPNECFVEVYNSYSNDTKVTVVKEGPCPPYGNYTEAEEPYDDDESPEYNQPAPEHQFYESSAIAAPAEPIPTAGAPIEYVAPAYEYGFPADDDDDNTPPMNPVPSSPTPSVPPYPVPSPVYNLPEDVETVTTTTEPPEPSYEPSSPSEMTTEGQYTPEPGDSEDPAPPYETE